MKLQPNIAIKPNGVFCMIILLTSSGSKCSHHVISPLGELDRLSAGFEIQYSGNASAGRCQHELQTAVCRLLNRRCPGCVSGSSCLAMGPKLSQHIVRVDFVSPTHGLSPSNHYCKVRWTREAEKKMKSELALLQ